VLSGAFLSIVLIGYRFVHGPLTFLAHCILTFAFGVNGSGILYVILAGYHVKAVEVNLVNQQHWIRKPPDWQSDIQNLC
jgi:MFS transporter, DHA1 family, inner membrane transport protein